MRLKNFIFLPHLNCQRGLECKSFSDKRSAVIHACWEKTLCHGNSIFIFPTIWETVPICPAGISARTDCHHGTPQQSTHLRWWLCEWNSSDVCSVKLTGFSTKIRKKTEETLSLPGTFLHATAVFPFPGELFFQDHLFTSDKTKFRSNRC